MPAAFSKSMYFSSSFENNCQQKSVPPLLLALVNMVLERPCIKDHKQECSTQAVLSIAQFLKFNYVTSDVKHSIAQETPVPIQ